MRTFKRGAHKRSWWKKKEGREGKMMEEFKRMTEMKVGMCCKEKGYGVPVEKHTRGYSRVFKTKLRLKERSAVAN